MNAMTPAQLTDCVVEAFGRTPDPRIRELLTALITALHAFAVQTRLTPQEWLAGLQFLTATGQKCDAQRQEFILLSDVLGMSSLVGRARPLLRTWRAIASNGSSHRPPEDGSPTLVRGLVTKCRRPAARPSRPT
jgi:Catechol dioxygenase N terminus